MNGLRTCTLRLDATLTTAGVIRSSMGASEGRASPSTAAGRAPAWAGTAARPVANSSGMAVTRPRQSADPRIEIRSGGCIPDPYILCRFRRSQPRAGDPANRGKNAENFHIFAIND